ncbi:MAG: hypothetical protein EOP85_19640, partial [Verrucomicrobiaceae bacterium]
MKPKFSNRMLVAMAGLILGFSAASLMAPADHARSIARANRHTTERKVPDAEMPNTSLDDGTPRTLEDLEKHYRTKGAGPDLAGHLERLTPEEIRSLMEALWEVQRAGEVDPGVLPVAIQAAARELYRREGIGALEWGNTLAEQGKSEIFEKLVMAAVEDSPEQAKPWVDIFQSKYAFPFSNPFREVAFRAASTKGVDAVLEARRILGGGVGEQLVYGPLPDDFDFKRMLAEAPDSMGSHGAVGFESAVELWAGTDPDAAWQALMETGGDNRKVASRYLDSIFNGMSQTVGE